MSDTRGLGKCRIDGSPIGTQHSIGIDPRQQCLANVGRIEFLQDHIGHRPTAVSDHQYRHVIRACASRPTDATALARRAVQMTLSFQRLEEKRLIRFHNAMDL
jgi:hypothetical protein